MNSKGFLLLDSLVAVVIVTSIAVLCFGINAANQNYIDGYLIYKDETYNRYMDLYYQLGECEKCLIEEDSLNLEP